MKLSAVTGADFELNSTDAFTLLTYNITMITYLVLYSQINNV